MVRETIRHENITNFSKQEEKARCTRSGSHTSLVIEEPEMNEKFDKSKFPKFPKPRTQ